MIYGTLKDEDDNNWDRLTVTCSPECRSLGMLFPDDPTVVLA